MIHPIDDNEALKRSCYGAWQTHADYYHHDVLWLLGTDPVQTFRLLIAGAAVDNRRNMWLPKAPTDSAVQWVNVSMAKRDQLVFVGAPVPDPYFYRMERRLLETWTRLPRKDEASVESKFAYSENGILLAADTRHANLWCPSRVSTDWLTAALSTEAIDEQFTFSAEARRMWLEMQREAERDKT